MQSLLAVVAAKAVIATLLAVIAALGARFLRRPAIVHTLWLIVLLELLGPPIFRVAILPGMGSGKDGAARDASETPIGPPTLAGRAAAGTAADEASDRSPLPDPIDESTALAPKQAMGRPDPERRSTARPPQTSEENVAAAGGPSSTAARTEPVAAAGSRVSVLARLEAAAPFMIILWAWGAFLVLVLASLRWREFRRQILASRGRSYRLQARARKLAAGMGLARCPVVHTVESPIAPMVGWSLGRLEIFFPEELAERLSADEQDALLAHELAHVARRDHWVRFVELGAAAAFWWHPVSWWARRGLRQAEERACDERVLESMPELARSYAAAMIETVDFLAGSHAQSTPALVSGLDEFTNLKERLTMILDDPSSKRSSRLQR